MADGENDEKVDEKNEKPDEKEREKQQEKSWDEKWERDPLSVVVWAVIFIWAGLVFLASNLGILDSILKGVETIPGIGALNNVVRAWPLVLIGAGVIVLIEILIRLLVPAYHKPVLGSLIIAILLIALGLGDLINWGIIWASLLIIVGIYILVRGFRKRPG